MNMMVGCVKWLNRSSAHLRGIQTKLGKMIKYHV